MKMTGLARLGRNAELRRTPQGEAVADIALAYNYGKKGEDGNRPSEWIKASLWGKRAEVLAQYLLKGSQISVTLDDPHIQTYQKADGTTGLNLVARVNDIELISAPRDGQQAAQRQAPRQAAPQQAPQRNDYADERGAPQPQRQAPRPASGFDDMDDDIPFN